MTHPWRPAGADQTHSTKDGCAAIRDEKLALAKKLAPAIVSAPGVDALVLQGCITTAADLVGDGIEREKQIDIGRVPHLLVEDTNKPDKHLTVAVYGYEKNQEPRTGLCALHTDQGTVLVSADTAIYWS